MFLINLVLLSDQLILPKEEYHKADCPGIYEASLPIPQQMRSEVILYQLAHGWWLKWNEKQEEYRG